MKTESRILLLYGGKWATIAIVLRGNLVDTLSILPPKRPRDTALDLLNEPYIKEVRKVLVHSIRKEWKEDIQTIMGPSIHSVEGYNPIIRKLLGFAESIDAELGRLKGVA